MCDIVIETLRHFIQFFNWKWKEKKNKVTRQRSDSTHRFRSRRQQQQHSHEENTYIIIRVLIFQLLRRKKGSQLKSNQSIKEKNEVQFFFITLKKNNLWGTFSLFTNKIDKKKKI